MDIEIARLAQLGMRLAIEVRRLAHDSGRKSRLARKNSWLQVMAGGIGQSALEFQMGQQTARGVARRSRGFLPCGLKPFQRGIREGLLILFQVLLQQFEPSFLTRAWKRQERGRVAALAVQPLFGDGIEERVKAVKILLRNGIVFMIVAARAPHR